MSLLDDLKKEADKKNTQAKVENTQVSEEDRKILLSKMALIKNYYSELVEHLNVLLPDEVNDFDLTKDVAFKGTKKSNYAIKYKDKFEKESAYFRFDQIGPRKIRVNLRSIDGAERFRNLLKRNEINHVDKMESDSRIIFTIEPKVTAKFDYLANLNNGFIELKITNFNEIWSQSIRYSPNKITNELLDETAKYILGNTNKFKEMSGGTITDTARTRIQHNLKKEKEKEKESEPEKDKSIINFFRKSI